MLNRIWPKRDGRLDHVSSHTTSGPSPPGSWPETIAPTGVREDNGRQTNERRQRERMASDKGVAKTRPREKTPIDESYEENQSQPALRKQHGYYDQHPSTATDATRRLQTSQVREERVERCDVGERTESRGSKSASKRRHDIDDKEMLRRRVAELEGQNAALTRELQKSQAHTYEMEHRLGSINELLQARTKEWKIAQQFLTTADLLTESDVIQKVERLNSEVFQLSGQIAMALPARQPRKPGHINNEMLATLGNDLHNFLENSCRAAVPSAAIQVAIQAVLITYCTHLISSWHDDNSFNDHIKSLYLILENTVELSIAGKWRALTRLSLDRLHNLDSQLIDSKMFTILSTVLIAAGFDHAVPPSTLKRDLTLIAGLTLELRRAVVVTESCDLEAFYFPFDTPFDANVMANNFRENRTRAVDINVIEGVIPKVFLTTEMGLKRLKRADDRLRGTPRVQEILLQPKVVLGSDLEHLL